MIYSLPIFLFCLVGGAVAVHDSLNFVLHSGHRSCFYEHFESNAKARTIDAFVQSGSGAFLQVYGPLSLDEIREEKFAESPLIMQRIDATKESVSETQSFTQELLPKLEGTYAICLDNSHNSFLDNLVQLDIRKGPKEVHYELSPSEENEKKVEEKEEKKEDNDGVLKALESISRVRKGLVAVQIQQLRDRRRLILYSETNKTNRFEMLVASLAETAVFVIAAIFQIYFVRRWFAKRESNTPQSANPAGAMKMSA